MTKTPMPKIGFIGWNPFQVLHSLPVARQLENSYFILEKRKHYIHEFSQELLTALKVPFIVWDPKHVRELDGLFDAIVCQTVFTQIEHFKKTRIAMLQYGLAKEVHNYGAWRSLADLNLVYGPYSAQRIGQFSPVEMVGIPRFDAWHDEGFISHTRAKYRDKIDPARKTILYLPTWGDLSSIEPFLDSVMKLGREFNVLLKLHHNTAIVKAERAHRRQTSRVHSFGANDDIVELLAVSDLVLSDYSGAIFDALYCRKPIVLLQRGDPQGKIGNKFDLHSLEHSARHRIGPVIGSPADLDEAVQKSLAGHGGFREQNELLRTELFVDGPLAPERAANALRQMIAGEYHHNPTQSQIRRETLKDRRKRAA